MSTLSQRALLYQPPAGWNTRPLPPYLQAHAMHASPLGTLDYNVSGQLGFNSVPPNNTASPMQLGLTVPTIGTRFGSGLTDAPITCEKRNDAITQEELFGPVEVVPTQRQQEIAVNEQIRDKYIEGPEIASQRPGYLNGAWAHPNDFINGGSYVKASFASGERLNLKTPFQHNQDRYGAYAPSVGNLHQTGISGTLNRSFLPGGRANAPLPAEFTKIRDPAFDVGYIQGFPRTNTNKIPAYPVVANQRFTMRSSPYG